MISSRQQQAVGGKRETEAVRVVGVMDVSCLIWWYGLCCVFIDPALTAASYEAGAAWATASVPGEEEVDES